MTLRRTLGVLWLAASVAGLGLLARYSGTSSALGDAPNDWPAASAISRSTGKTTILMFAHPRCPCTRASIAELERILARAGDRVRATVLFVSPQGSPSGWAQSGLWERAAAVPGLRLLEDREGIEARRFGALTSGHVLVFSVDGKRIFSGGITSSRGHEGDNEGKTLVLEVLQGNTNDARAAVYGCALFDQGDRDDEVRG